MVLENVIIRQMRKADIDEAMQLKRAENWNQTEEDWKMLLALNPSLCLVASYNNTIVGTATAINYNDNVAWIGMMLVSKAFRGLGISKYLLSTIIEKLNKCKSIKLDATPEGVPVYQKLGFKVEFEIDRMVASKVDMSYSEINGSSVRPILKDDIGKVLKNDLKIFGSDRSKLILFLFKNHRDKAWCLQKNKILRASVFGRPGSNFMQVGPLIAETTDDAQKLITVILRHFVGNAVVLDVLSDKIELKNMLTLLGFVIQRSFSRMYLNNNTFHGFKERQFLIAGPEVG